MKEALILQIIQPEEIPVVMRTHEQIFFAVKQQLIRIVPLLQIPVINIPCGKINALFMASPDNSAVYFSTREK